MVKINKKYNRNYTVIQNTIFEFNEKLPKDQKMSFKAIGIFFYLWHLPADWEFYESEIINHSRENITAFRTGREELERYGFIHKKRRRNTKGQVSVYEWTLDDSPALDYLKQEKPTLDYPTQEKPKQENQHLLSTNGTKYLKNKVSSSGSESSTTDQVVQNSSESSKPSSKPKINPKKNPYELYQQLWGFPNSIVRQDLQEWINEFSSDVVYYAIYTAGKRNVSSWGSGKYLKTVFDSWEKEKVKNLEQAKKQNAEHERRNERNCKSRKPYNSGKRIKEELPDWAKDKPKEPKDDKPVEDEDKQALAERKAKLLSEIDNL